MLSSFKIIIILLLATKNFGQSVNNFCANYISTHQIFNPEQPGKLLTIIQYEGELFKKDNEIIYTEKKITTNQYDSIILYRTKDGIEKEFRLSTALFKTINYFNLDSSIYKFCTNTVNELYRNTKFKFERGFHTWKIMPETKIVDGVFLQRAITLRMDGSVGRDVWFAPEIPIFFGPWGIIDAPGLIFEGTEANIGVHFKLKSYQMECIIEPTIFKMEQLNKTFIDRGTLKKRTN